MLSIQSIDVFFVFLLIIPYRKANNPMIVCGVLKSFSTFWTTLSKYVKAMRKQYNLTQMDLSEKSGVGLRFVRELEQGKQTLRLDKVNQILNLFGAEVGAVPMTKTDE